MLGVRQPSPSGFNFSTATMVLQGRTRLCDLRTDRSVLQRVPATRHRAPLAGGVRSPSQRRRSRSIITEPNVSGKPGGLSDPPGDGGAHPGRMPCPTGTCRFTTASPYTPLTQPTCGAPLYETSTRVHAIHPSGLPLTRSPRMEQGPLGVPSSSAPRRHQQRTSRGAKTRARARNYATDTMSALQSASPLAKCNLVSQRHRRMIELCQAHRPERVCARCCRALCGSP